MNLNNCYLKASQLNFVHLKHYWIYRANFTLPSTLSKCLVFFQNIPEVPLISNFNLLSILFQEWEFIPKIILKIYKLHSVVPIKLLDNYFDILPSPWTLICISLNISFGKSWEHNEVYHNNYILYYIFSSNLGLLHTDSLRHNNMKVHIFNLKQNLIFKQYLHIENHSLTKSQCLRPYFI